MDHYTRLIAIRHGETAWNREGRIQGHADIGLNDLGRAQAQALARALDDESIDAVFSSDLSRAAQTACPLAARLGLEVRVDAGLRERGFGVYEGLDWREIETKAPQDAERWRHRDPEFSAVGGESLLQFHARVIATVDRIASAQMGRSLALVAHGGVMDCLFRAASRLDLQQARTWPLGNASINRLLWTPQGMRVVGWGDSRHLDALMA